MCAEYMPERKSWITNVSWSPSGTTLAFAVQDQYLYTVDLCNDNPSITHSIPLPGLALSQLLFVGNNTIICGGYDGQPYIYNTQIDHQVMMNDERRQMNFQKLIPIIGKNHHNNCTNLNSMPYSNNNNNSMIKNHVVTIRTSLQESFFCNEKKGIIDIHVPKKSYEKNAPKPEYYDVTITNEHICSAVSQMKVLTSVNNTNCTTGSTVMVSSLGINNDFRIWKVPDK